MSEKKKYLHLVFDGRFIDWPMHIFEKALPGENRFLLLTSGSKDDLTLVNDTDKVEISPWNIKKVLRELDHHDIVFLHWLDEFKRELILKAPKHIKFVWILWGADLYETHPVFKDVFIEPDTREYINSHKREIQSNRLKLSIRKILKETTSIRNIFRYFTKLSSAGYLLLGKRKYANPEYLYAVLNRLDYIACYSKEEEDFIRKYVDTTAKYLHMNAFGTIDDFVHESIQSTAINGDNILVGNSANATNNHIGLLNQLSRMNLNARKVIIPLAYGNDWYRDLVIEHTGNVIKCETEYITELIRFEKYCKKISSCNVMIMNHIRQQAIASIIAGLQIGMRVYMNEENSIYSLLKNRGVILFSIQKDLVPENSVALSSLSKDDIAHNRKILVASQNGDLSSKSA